MTQPILGIDLSVYNFRRGVPFRALPALHAAGVRFLIGRASIGTAIDRSFEANRKRAERKGWVAGAYHFLTDSAGGTPQADTFAREISGTGGIGGLLTILDVENAGRTNRPTLKAVRAFAERFATHFPRHKLGVYSNRSTWTSLGNPDIDDLGFAYAWHAYWPRDVDQDHLPARPPVGFGGEGRIPLWQYGPFHVRFGGKDHRLDGNAWYGSLEELRHLGLGERLPLPERPAYIAAYNETITTIALAVPHTDTSDPTPTGRAGRVAAVDAAGDAVEALRIGTPEP